MKSKVFSLYYMAARVNFVAAIWVIYCNINYVSAIKCYECQRCSLQLNFTSDTFSVVPGCKRCQTTMDYIDSLKADRRCVTPEQEHLFDLLDVNYQPGCRNISQIQTVEDPKFYCFCTENLCNGVASRIKANIHFFILILTTLTSLFHTGMGWTGQQGEIGEVYPTCQLR